MRKSIKIQKFVIAVQPAFFETGNPVHCVAERETTASKATQPSILSNFIVLHSKMADGTRKSINIKNRSLFMVHNL